MIKAQLRAMKDARGMTNKELSELSKVPLPTVNRIMAGQTEAPTYQTVCDLVKAMGGSLDELAGISRPQASAGDIPEEAYRRVIAEKNTWIKRLFIVCCILVAVIVVVLIIDILDPAIGYIHR